MGFEMDELCSSMEPRKRMREGITGSISFPCLGSGILTLDWDWVVSDMQRNRVDLKVTPACPTEDGEIPKSQQILRRSQATETPLDEK
jgi:hypothetical protein